MSVLEKKKKTQNEILIFKSDHWNENFVKHITKCFTKFDYKLVVVIFVVCFTM